MKSPREQARAAAAVVAVVSLVVLAFLMLRDRRTSEPPRPGVTLVPAASAPVASDDPGQARAAASRATEGAGAADRRPIDLDLPPPAGRTWFVRGGSGTEGDGSSAEQPLRGLQAAFERLTPGDRLVVLPGEYVGPFRIAETSADGTEQTPIEVVGRPDAVVTLEKGATAPLLTVARSHWRLLGLELKSWPLSPVAGIRIDGPASGVEIAQSHIHDGGGEGVDIAAGARDVVLRQNHLHHLGHDRTGRPVSAVRIERGATVLLESNKTHVLTGPEPVELFAFGELTRLAPEASKGAEVEVEGVRFRANELSSGG
jgi:hypothetical protein